MPKLVITDGDGVREVPLTGEVKAGRLSENAIQLKVPEASRQHCRYFLEKGSWFVEDMGSSNGTLVNGRKVSKFELADGDVISVGAASMKFLDVDVAPTAAEPVGGGWGDDDELSLESETFLVLAAPGRIGEIVKLVGDRVTVGRLKKNLLAIADASISGEHAELLQRGGGWSVRDLGSSNGTFVEGERVKEQALKAGQVIRFGAVDARFGVGKPKDFAAPAQEAQALTTAIDLGGVGQAIDDAAFQIHQEAAPRRGALGGVLGLVLLIAIGGAAAYLYMNQTDGGAGGFRPSEGRTSSNLIPEAWWSFEPRPASASIDEGGWRKEDPLDRAAFDSFAPQGRSGEGCLTVERGPDAGPPSYFVLDAGMSSQFTASPGSAYRLGASARRNGPIFGGPSVFWYGPPAEGETAPRLVGREIVPALGGEGWNDVSAVVSAPDGAVHARVGFAVAGVGEASFDDVIFEGASAQTDTAFDIKGFRAALSPTSAVRVTRIGRAVIDGAGVWRFPANGEPSEPWTGFAPGDESGSATGVLEGLGSLTATIAKGENGFTASWTLGGAWGDYAFGIPLAGTMQDLNVAVFDGDRATRQRAAFADLAATAVIVGDRGERVRIGFVDAEGKPLSVRLSVVAKAGRPVLKAVVGDDRRVNAEFRLAFDAEQKEARELLARAGELLRAGKDGDALKLYEEALARFSFDEGIEQEAAQRRDRALSDAQKRLRDLTTKVDDALFFRTARRDDGLAKELETEAARLGGSALEGALKALRERFDTERNQLSAERAETEARRALLRAMDYLADARGRPTTAAAFFESIKKRYPGTEEAKQAAVVLERIAAGRGAGGPEGTKPEEKR